MTCITKDKVITTCLALITLLTANKPIFYRVSILAIFTSDHMSSLLSMEREYTKTIYFLTLSNI
jgi:hypothetical protein